VRDLVATGLFGAAVGLAVFRSLGANPPHDDRPLEEPLAHEIYFEATDREGDQRREAAFRFPGSLWSQEDDFFAKQTMLLKNLAGNEGVALGSILFVLDRGMREKWPPAHADVVISPKAVPCRPRLAYH
jgi:hypothetical protein